MRKAADPGGIVCPACGKRIPLPADFCLKCQFPLVCDVEAAPKGFSQKQRNRRRLAGIITAAAVLVFAVTQILWFQYRNYSDEHFGFTTAVHEQVSPLSETEASWLAINGDDLFKERTLLTLGLIKTRSPYYYGYVKSAITEVSEIRGITRLSVNNHPVELRPIGAMVESLSGKMWIKTKMAFGGSVTETWDWSVFNYAATFIHEAAHVDLNRQEKSLNTVEEEVFCETQALDFLTRTGAPMALIEQKQAYTKNPEARKYRAWYKWYHQFEDKKRD